MIKKGLAFITAVVSLSAALSVSANDDTFFIQPVKTYETFEETEAGGAPVLDFITSSGASAVEEEGNTYLSLNGKGASASVNVSLPNGCAHEKVSFVFDMNLPPLGGSVGINFYAVEQNKKERILAPALMNRSDLQPKNKFAFALTDGGINGKQDWKQAELSFDKWYEVRYDINMRSHIYTLTFTDKETGETEQQLFGRSTRDNKNNEYVSINDYYLDSIAFSVSNAEMKLDNIGITKESIKTFEAPQTTVEGGKIITTVTAANETKEEISSPILVTALYGKNNKLITAAYSGVGEILDAAASSASPSVKELKTEIDIPDSDSELTVSSFLITSLYGAKSYFAPQVLKIK